MASFQSQACGSAVNVPASISADVQNVVRNNDSVTFEYKPYLIQTSSSWSVNAWAIFANEKQYTVKAKNIRSEQDVPYYTSKWISVTKTGLSAETSSTSVAVGVDGTHWDPTVAIDTFNLKLVNIPTVSKPTLSSISSSGLTNTSVSASFSVSATNNGSITAEKIELSTDSDFSSIVQTETGRDVTFTGLTPNTTYYIRGYASNLAGTTYTNTISFTTHDKPVVNSLSYSSLTNVSAYLAFSLSSDRGGSISSRGIQLSLSNFGGVVKTINAYSGTASGLTPNTTYYARGYATNQYGTTYTNTVSFRTHDRPSVGTLSISGTKDKSTYGEFSLVSANGGSITAKGIQLSTTNFGNVVASISAYAGTISGLDPNRTYYARGYVTNQYGTTYTNTVSLTTLYYNPGLPTNPTITYSKEEPIPSSGFTVSWGAASAGSTAIAGYDIVLYRNDYRVSIIDTKSTELSYSFSSFENYRYQPGDVAKVKMKAYSLDWNGGKHYSDGDYIESNSVTVVSDKYIYVSLNGGAFDKHKIYISISGQPFKEVKKEKFKVI